MKERKRWLPIVALVLGGLFVLLGVGAVLVAVFVIRPMLRERVVAEAQKRGIELGFDEVEVSWSHLSVSAARFRLIGVKGVAGTVKRIDITTSSFEPTGIALEELHLDVLGSVPSLLLETTEWTKNYPSAFTLPLSARPVSVRWRTTEADQPWLSLAGGKVGRTAQGGNFSVPSANVAGVTLGPVGTRWTKEASVVRLGLGDKDAKNTPLTINVDFAKDQPTAVIRLEPTRTERLAQPLGVELPVKGVSVSSDVKLTFPNRLGTGPVTGNMKVTLDGYVPPHPPELDGFVFGKATLFESDFKVSEDRQTVTLDPSSVKAGAFQLKGKGVVQRHPDHAQAAFEFRGFLACTALAGAALETHLGQILSKLPKVVARQTLQGSVGVTIRINADTRDLENAKVLKLIGIGCGLRPLRVPTQEELAAFARELPGFVGALPSLADQLPLPKGLPAPPPSALFPPNLPLPTIEFKKATPKPDTEPPPKSGTTNLREQPAAPQN
ncbi:MAG TPA: hypothetical protein VFU02_18550 [Polyangiaceae bacterium]|nr:hypothetical protein [Polyangiaceae bacterium]